MDQSHNQKVILWGFISNICTEEFTFFSHPHLVKERSNAVVRWEFLHAYIYIYISIYTRDD